MTATCDYIQACGALRNKAENRKDGEEQMICPRCGANNQDGNKFCVSCGSQLFNQNYNVPPMQQNNNSQRSNMNNGGYYQQQNMNYNGYCQPNQNMNQQPRKEKFYEKTWLIVLACIFLPPVGIVLMWISNKPKNLAARIIITVVLAFYTLVALVPGSSDDKNNAESNKQTVQESKHNETADSKEKHDEQKKVEEQKEPDIRVGSSFEVKGLKVTINDANTNFTDWGEYDSAPASGMKYIMVDFTFENTNSSGDKYVSIYDFDCYADNSTCDQAYLSDDSDFINTNLSPGRNVTFKTYYVVPENCTSIELEYHESMIGDAKTKIIIQ